MVPDVSYDSDRGIGPFLDAIAGQSNMGMENKNEWLVGNAL